MDDAFTREQRALTKIALESVGPCGFVLAGSGALREHGIVDRVTRDIDLFGSTEHIGDTDRFRTTVDKLETALLNAGYEVSKSIDSDQFAQLKAKRNGIEQQIEMGLDYREFPPSELTIGPVLDIRDAVANKTAAAITRQEPRDFIDLQAIRDETKFSDRQLLDLAEDHDIGITDEYARDVLYMVRQVPYDDVRPYGIDPTRFETIQNELVSWADEIGASDAKGRSMIDADAILDIYDQMGASDFETSDTDGDSPSVRLD